MKPGSGKSNKAAHTIANARVHQLLIDTFGDAKTGYTAMLKELGQPFQVIRNFAIINTTDSTGFNATTTIMDLATGSWRGFNLPYQHALNMLSSPERDPELLDALHL